MKNTIAVRIADFLRLYPPFNLLKPEELKTVSEEITVQYNTGNELLFNQGSPCSQYFYIIHQGAVEIFHRDKQQNITLDRCDEGDLFGLRPLFSGENYKISAKTLEECILYLIPIEVFSPLITSNQKIREYLLNSLASNTQASYSEDTKGITGPNLPDLPTATLPHDVHELQKVSYSKRLVACQKETPIKQLAETMNNNHVGSVIILDNDLPAGIVTDKDIRVKIASGDWDISAPAKNIMSSPVICYPESITIAQAYLAMMKHGISHLCITKDGTPNTKVIGIVSEHDLIVSQGNNPSYLMKAITRASKTKQLKKIRRKIMVLLEQYMDSNLPMTQVSRILFELNDATIKRCIALSLKKMGTPPPCKFAWLTLGSQGRKEQLLHTDQDNAIIFEDQDEDRYPEVQDYFLTLARAVNQRLLKLGFDYCPAEMMAGNPRWCLSESQWKEQFTHWVQTPTEEHILLCQVFFDYDISYGNLDLANALADHIFKTITNYPIFTTNLAKSALENPSPLGFFRQFLLERNGEYKDHFDLKKRALMPITDAARLLILGHKTKNINNTFERYDKLAELEPHNNEIFLGASYAAKVLLKFRTRQGLQNHDSGRYIDLKKLSKEEKIKLKRCFKTISDLQDLIKLRFKLVNIV